MSARTATAGPELGPRRSPLATARRLFQGDLVSLRVIVAIALIWIIFQSQNGRFLSAVNLTNLVLQITATGLISVGVVFVLILGEIDLSVGAASGVTSALMAVLNVQHGWNPYLAIAAALVLGLAIGLLQGALFSSFGVPSFIITLAGLLAWQGLQLYVLGDTGSVNVTDGRIVGLANHFYSDAMGWVFAAVVIVAYAGTALRSLRARRAAGLADTDAAGPLARSVIVAAATIAIVAVLNSSRGVPLAVLILVAFVAGMQYVATRTLFGRHVFALGGNAEAARRAGIRIKRIRILVFGISGTMAAIGGILAASRLLAVDQSSGGSDLLLFAIAGPVIAGTSLFGGRGSVWSALLGAITIGSISNGMDLLAFQSSVKFMVTGGVLVAAVLVDALAQRNRRAGPSRPPLGRP
jgi:D-xylose transport system permease protein